MAWSCSRTRRSRAGKGAPPLQAGGRGEAVGASPSPAVLVLEVVMISMFTVTPRDARRPVNIDLSNPSAPTANQHH